MTKTLGQVLRENNWQSAPVPAHAAKILCVPNCEICGGIGYVRNDVPVWHPHFGKTFPCPNLPANSSIWHGHGLSARDLESLTWSRIVDRENVSDAVDALVSALRRGGGLGYLYGGAGLAKTKLLKILCAEWVRSGNGLFHFTTQKEILDDMRTAFDDDEPQRAIRDKQLKYESFPLLAIDEVTIERSTDFKIEQFFHLLNKRHEAGTEDRKRILTVMAGNISPSQLDYRITDRLSDGRNFVVRLTGESFRPAMKDEL